MCSSSRAVNERKSYKLSSENAKVVKNEHLIFEQKNVFYPGADLFEA